MSTHPFDHIKMKTAPAYMQSEVQDYNLKKARAGDSQGFGFLYAFTHTKKCRGLARGRFSLCIYIQGEVGLRGRWDGAPPLGVFCGAGCGVEPKTQPS